MIRLAIPVGFPAIAALASISACAVAAQGLSPEVLLRSRIKHHVRDQVARLPNCTCLETVARFHKEAGRASKLESLDTVRLEVVYTDGREWYGSPGARNLSEKNPAAFIGAGMIANGMFGITLHNLFVSEVATFTPRGDEAIDGRPAVKYDFRLPRTQLGQEISIPGGSGTVGEAGSFWADPTTLDLVRLTARVAEIPDYLPLTSAVYSVNYARTRIDQFDAMLAQQADLDMQLASGVEDYDRFDFTHCRAFQSHSEIRFDADDNGTAAPPPAASSGGVATREVEVRLPALLLVTVQLTTAITDQDAIGKLIEARISGDVRSKGKVLIADGALVHGRIRRLDRYPGQGHFAIGLEFTEVQTRDGPARFYADLLRLEKRAGIQPVLQESVRLPDRRDGSVEIKLPELPGVASFFVEGKSFVLPGLQTVWRTRGPLHGVD
ncbi:MAG: hypothetical protein WBY44_19820 [Bryobacteraceae bacterium]